MFAFLFNTVQENKGSVEEFMYNVDVDGSSLLHLAVNSGILGVRKWHGLH